MRTNQINSRNLILVVMALVALSAMVLLGVHDISLFELDGDAEDAALVAGEDWDRVLGIGSFTTPSGTDEAHVFVNDGTGATIFTTGGSKDDLDVSQWRHTNGMVPDKDDILNAFAAAFNNPTTVGDNLAGDLILYFGADRFANNGDAQIGFWFFKQRVGLATDGTFVDGSGDPAHHTVGDILIISDFTQGGNISTITIYEWVGTGGDTNGTLDLLFSGQDCSVTSLANDAACAIVNDIPQPSPWPFEPKFGDSNEFPTGSLFEGGINISRIDRLNERVTPGCFTGFLAETRSSQSVDAQLKDFAFGAFDLCAARISIEEDATNEVNDDHTFTITVEKKGPPNFAFEAASGIEVTAELEEGSVGSFDGSNVCTTGTDGTCTVTINSSAAGTSTVSASASVTVDGVTFEIETDGDGGNSDAAVKTWVDAKIGIADPGTNEVGQPHTFIVTLEKDPGTGFVAAAGEDVDFNLTSSFGADCQVDEEASTCDDAGANTDDNGQCTIVFSSASAGQCVGSASATLLVGGETLVRSTDGSSENSGEATKTYVDASIAITPESDTNPVGQQHTFTITVTVDDGSGSGASGVEGVFPTVAINPTPDSVSDGCADDNVNTGTDASGQCTVVINHGSPETFTANASVTVTVGEVSLSRDTAGNSGPDGSGPAQKTYVAGNIIVQKVTDPAGSDQTFSFTADYDNDGFSLSDGDSNDSGSLAPGTYSVSENNVSGWALTSATCDDGSDPDAIGLAASETVTCTFVNSQVGTIIIEKETDPEGSDESFSFTATYDDDGFSLQDNGSNDSGALDPNSYTIMESVPEGWDLASIQCSGETGSVITLGDGGFFGPENSVNIQLVVGETITCTFNNKQLAKIIVEKDTEPAGSTQSFSFTTDYGGGGFSLQDGGSNDSGYIDPGTYSVSEGGVAGWDLISATCDDDSEPGAIDLDPGETVTCTFLNRQRGTIIVEKQTNPDGADGSFTFSGDAVGSLGDGDQITVSNIVAGTYTSTEADPTPDFDLTSISCNDGSSLTVSSWNVSTRTATFKLDPGETVKCTFTNRERGMARVIKSFLGQPLGGNLSFSFDLRQGATLTSLGTVLESGVANASNGGVINFSTKIVPGDTYQLCETGILPGWDTSLAHTAGVFVPGGSLPDPDNSALCIDFTVDPGQTREFRINNTPPPGGLAHTIGFWKNWTSCDGNGNQAPVLDQTLGSVGGILIGDVVVDTCAEAVSLLNKSDISSGRKLASDPAYGMAAQLLAAQLNFVAGANTCTAATDAVAQAQALLDSINFIGTGNYANKGKNKQEWQAQANNLAGILDAYNNNFLCFEF